MVPHSTNVSADEALDLLESWLDAGNSFGLDPAQELGVHNAIREMREHADIAASSVDRCDEVQAECEEEHAKEMKDLRRAHEIALGAAEENGYDLGCADSLKALYALGEAWDLGETWDNALEEHGDDFDQLVIEAYKDRLDAADKAEAARIVASIPSPPPAKPKRKRAAKKAGPK